MAENKCFREYYSSTFNELLQEDLKIGIYNYRESYRNAKSRLRMYANLFNRDMRKKLLNEHSSCVVCNTREKLTIDHILPITKGGKNEENNIQVLCMKCNILKSNK